jgi:hypothetical protein
MESTCDSMVHVNFILLKIEKSPLIGLALKSDYCYLQELG